MQSPFAHFSSHVQIQVPLSSEEKAGLDSSRWFGGLLWTRNGDRPYTQSPIDDVVAEEVTTLEKARSLCHLTPFFNNDPSAMSPARSYISLREHGIDYCGLIRAWKYRRELFFPIVGLAGRTFHVYPNQLDCFVGDEFQWR